MIASLDVLPPARAAAGRDRKKPRQLQLTKEDSAAMKPLNSVLTIYINFTPNKNGRKANRHPRPVSLALTVLNYVTEPHMYLKILWFLVLLALPSIAFAEQDVTFSASFPDFAVVSTATGKVSKSGPFISVLLEYYTMRASTKYKVPQKVLRYKVGLAFSKPNGQWDVVRWSAPFEFHTTILPGETQLIKNVKAAIPIDNIPSLKDSWLVLTVEMDNNCGVGYTYAQSNKSVF